jgi:ATP-dependent Lhr-like helicase
MKQGRLRAVVATGSLELGIDIGSVEEVILVGTPPSVAQSLQRIGRADHRVGGTSKASLFVLHGLDGAQAASMEAMVRAPTWKRSAPSATPSTCWPRCCCRWAATRLGSRPALRLRAHHRRLPRAAAPPLRLGRRHAGGPLRRRPIRELRQRALVDRAKNTFTTRAGTEFVLYQSGGTIPDRGYYHLRLADSKAVIGELDEEFVWERRLGDQFSLGTQAWRILNVTHNDVEVGPADPHGPMIPFWKAEEQNRSTQASFALLDFFDVCEKRLDEPDFADELARTTAWTQPARAAWCEFLTRQREVSGAPARPPARARRVHQGSVGANGNAAGGAAHLLGRQGQPAPGHRHGRGVGARARQPARCLCHQRPHSVHAARRDRSGRLFELVPAQALDELLRAGLEKTALFGSRFRENASRALLLPRGDARKRYPLWLNRLRSKKLLASVLRFEDFSPSCSKPGATCWKTNSRFRPWPDCSTTSPKSASPCT